MKKVLGILALVAVLMLSFVGCNNNNKQNENNQNGGNSVVDNQENNQQNTQEEEQNTVILEPVNTTYAVADELNTAQPITGLAEESKMSQADIDANYEFGKYKELQMEVRSLATEDSFKEVAIIKVGENDQSTDLFQIMIKRLEALKEKYKDNEKISTILNNNESLILKQQGGILIFIVAENAKEVEAQLDKSFM